MGELSGVVFDFDGTLFDTRPAIVYCIERLFADAGWPMPGPDAIAAVVQAGIPLGDTLAALKPELGEDSARLDRAVSEHRAVYRTKATEFINPYPGVVDTLRSLQADGVKILVVSNKSVGSVQKSLDDAGLTSIVDTVFGDEPHLPKKPDPSILNCHVLPRHAGLVKDRLLIVGDTEVDILFAKATGVTSCWASYGYGDPARCRELRPDHTIETIGQVLALIRPAHNALSDR